MFSAICWQSFSQFYEVFLFSHACGKMIYSETLAAKCESTWMNESQSTGEGSFY